MTNARRRQRSLALRNAHAHADCRGARAEVGLHSGTAVDEEAYGAIRACDTFLLGHEELKQALSNL